MCNIFNGNDVDKSIFTDKKLTMVNVWGTYCGACIEEMPDLQEIYTEMKNKGVNVVGIVMDGEKNKDRALTILK